MVRDQEMLDEVNDAYRQYTLNTPRSNLVPRADRIYEDIIGLPAVIPGEMYQSFRSDFAKMARATKDPDYKHYLNSVNRALDNAMERSIAVINPDDVGAFREARREYRNLMVIDDAVTSNEHGARGILTPDALKRAIDKDEYAYGTGDFGDLAKAGKAVMTTMPDSGSAARAAMHAIPATSWAIG